MTSETPIRVEDASLSTVAIEVKVLRIGKRQMTLAVFRQLPKRPVIDGAGKIVGTAWGHVNYHQDCPEEPHLHVIWQDGGVLYQSTVQSDPALTKGYAPLVEAQYEAGSKWLVSATLEGWRPQGQWKRATSTATDGALRVGIGKHVVMLYPSYAVSELLDSSRRLEDARQHDERDGGDRQVSAVQRLLARTREEVERERAKTCGDSSHDELLREFEEADAAVQAYEDAYQASYAQLAALDQLFIAV